MGSLKAVLALLKHRYLYIVWVVWIVIGVELLSRGDLLESLKWGALRFPVLLLNAVLVGGLLLLLSALTGNPRLSFWLVAATSLTLAAVSGIKLRLKGLPLLPWDFTLLGEAGDVMDWQQAASLSLFVGIPCFLAVSYLLVHRLTPSLAKPGARARLIAGALAVATVALVYVDRPFSVCKLLGGAGTPWDQVENVRTTGFALSLFRNLHYLTEDPLKPADAPALAAVDESDGDRPQNRRSAPARKDVRPNVIVVLSETFWDPTRLKNVSFSQDPVPFLHQLQESYPSGYMLSPEFGGSTANVELEVLTGLSMRLLPNGVLAYEKYINHPVDSLASIFARQGYRTTAISPWPAWFFNSKRVYEYFGFGKFISLEFMRPVFGGPGLIADSEIAKMIIAETERSEGPHFVFANTAENHWPYSPDKFAGGNQIKVTGLSPASAEELATYAEGSKHADEMLKTLVQHFEQTKEPTILVFFGDHLPLLGKNYRIYKESRYITGEDDPEFLEKIHRVPVVVWNNYLPQQKERLDFGTTFLGPYILNLAKVPGTPVTRYLEEFSKRIPAIPPRTRWPAYGISEADMKQYEALQYDILFGEGKVYGELKDQIVDPNYVLGYGPMSLTGTSVAKSKGDIYLTVQGENLPPTSVVYFNDNPLPTTWESFERLKAKLPDDSKGALTGDVVVRVIDKRKDAITAETNKISVSHE